MRLAIRSLAARLSTAELPVLGLLVIGSIAVERLLPVALAAAIFFWLVRGLAYDRLTVRTPGDWPIGLLISMIPITLWATALPEVTRTEALRLLLGLALYYAVVNWTNSSSRLALVAVGLVTAGLALATLAPLLGGLPAASRLIPAGLMRIFQRLSSAVNPNVIAGTLAVLAPLALALCLFPLPRRTSAARVLGLVAALAMIGATALTASRGAWMGLTAALLVLIALRWRWGWLASLLATAGCAVAIWRIGPPQVAEMLVASKALGGAEQRLEIWSRALYMLQDFPFTGIGMGAFRQVANLFYPLFLAGPNAEIPHAHNIFLQVGIDLGLPGLIAWLALLMLVIVCAWLGYRRGRERADLVLTGLSAGLLASQAALVIHGLTDAATWGTRPAVVVWAIWGTAMAAFALIPKRAAD